MLLLRLLLPWSVLPLALIGTAGDAAAPVADHPLLPVLQIAYDGYKRMEREIKDYTCTLAKRERVDGRLLEAELMVVKIRHHHVAADGTITPLGVYVRFLKPAEVKGREVLWVEGQNNGKMIVRNGGSRFQHITVAIPPDGDLAMQRNRYPLTEIGVKNLTLRLMENGQEELQYRDCDVKTVPGAKINNRPCTVIQVSHPVRRDHFTYQFARILVDDELQLPVYYAAYDWPKEDGGPARLLEEYTYTDIRLNVGLTAADFDHRNEKYQFLKSFEP